ncbi:FAD:protein FMN transferase [Carboxylicivirga caseinilyticus]|uniref:FAD:protein FMN transferase n=1 Tax=Carboxylicivirga caseinilyticus TaxID=3417572 RepID=UPI003D3346FE|nr:FAD:protein FMN transferase [Marinilabiliaceae bacterium A049]
MKRYTAMLVLGLLLVSCGKNTTFFKNEGLVFGTIYHFTYEADKDLDEEVKKVMNDFNMSLSTYQENSVISKINRNQSMETDEYFRTVFNKAKEITAATEGAFDMTVAPLVNAWGFGFSNKDSVTTALIDSLMEDVGMDMVELKEGIIVKQRPGIMLDASAIAKGYAVDVVADYLESKGVNNYMVEIGGEMRVKGSNPKGLNWKVGIDKPIDDPEVLERQLQEIISISNVALATSGNYRNFYLKDGKKYAHTISPYTGYPVVHQLLGVSVLAPDCMTADAYATAFMVLGVEKGMKIVENNPDLEAYFISAGTDGNEYEITLTEGFKKVIESVE